MSKGDCLSDLSAAGKVFIQSFLHKANDSPRSCGRIRHGRNNRAWMLETEKSRYFLKEYFRHPGDLRDRLSAEYSFSSFCIQSGIDCVPGPLAKDKEAAMAIYEWLDGRPPNEADESGIRDALAFTGKLAANSRSPLAAALPFASDACRKPEDHLHLANWRLDKLLKALDCKNGIYARARDFAQKELRPALASASRSVCQNISGMELARQLGPEELVPSPSDFGFHNAVMTKYGAKFVDFEYAGLDDPVKMVCDFFCQPQIPVDMCYMEVFCNSLAGYDTKKIFRHARLFLPVHRIKWCLIMLNGFMAVGADRRGFAGASDFKALEKQLEKVKKYFLNKYL